jgi:DNA-binding transcriptional LysR family regulator
VAILARYSIGLDLNLHELAVLDVEGFPIELNWNFVYPAGKHLSPIARAFVGMVKREAKSLLAAPASSSATHASAGSTASEAK